VPDQIDTVALIITALSGNPDVSNKNSVLCKRPYRPGLLLFAELIPKNKYPVVGSAPVPAPFLRLVNDSPVPELRCTRPSDVPLVLATNFVAVCDDEVSRKSNVVIVSLVTALVWVAGVIYPFRVTYRVWVPTATLVRLYGVTCEVSVPSRKIFAPEGVEVTVTDPVSWTRVKSAVAVWPFTTGTTRVVGVAYPLRVTYTLWFPAGTLVRVYGVTLVVSAPSRKIRAPEGVDVTVTEPVDVPPVMVKPLLLVSVTAG
jgi:hypothetical protein